MGKTIDQEKCMSQATLTEASNRKRKKKTPGAQKS